MASDDGPSGVVVILLTIIAGELAVLIYLTAKDFPEVEGATAAAVAIGVSLLVGVVIDRARRSGSAGDDPDPDPDSEGRSDPQ